MEQDVPDRRRIVVDGSNIATEGRTIPSLSQLDEAIHAFLEEFPGFTASDVTVVVDASFGHRIDPSEVPAFDQAVEHGEMITPPAGAVGRGDGFILRIAEKSGALVLSNDSFQEFHAERPWLFEPGRLIGGKPVPGVGWIFTPRTPVRGARSRSVTAKSRRALGASEDDLDELAEDLDAPSRPGARGGRRPRSTSTKSAASTTSGTSATAVDTGAPTRGAQKSTKAAKPTKSTKAAKAVKAVKAVKTTKPSRATKATKTGSVKTGEPIEVAKPARAAQPAKAAKATKAAQRTKPAKATESTKSTKAAKAIKPAKAAKPARAGVATNNKGATTTKAAKATKPIKATKATQATKADKAAAPEALNDPMTFLTFVADHPVGSTLEGTVTSFTSHGAHVAVDGMVCHVPLRGLADPPPQRARQVLKKGETRPFVLVSLDAARRRAELALPGIRA